MANENKIKEFVTVCSSNVDGITPFKTNGVLGDKISFQSNKERFVELKNGNKNSIPIQNVSVQPLLEEVTIKLNNSPILIKVVYVSDPTKYMGKTYINAYESYYDENGSSPLMWNEITKEELMERLELNGISKDGFRITAINDFLESMLINGTEFFKTAELSDEVYEAIETIGKMSRIEEDADGNKMLIPPTPDVENIEKLSSAIQTIWNSFSDEVKVQIVSALSKNDDSEMREELKKVVSALEDNKFNLTSTHLSHIDADTLYKLTDDYISSPSTKPVFQADKKMAKYVRKQNPQIASAVWNILNFKVTGITVNNNVLSHSNESVKTLNFFNKFETISKNEGAYFAEMMSNEDRFKKAISKFNDLGALKVFGVWHVLTDKSKKFTITVDDADSLSPEEFKARIEELKAKMNSDKGLIAEFGQLVDETLKFVTVLRSVEAKYISDRILRTFEENLKLIKNKLGEENLTDLLVLYKRGKDAVTNALNLFKETMYSFYINAKDTIVPTEDGTRFPKGVSNSATVRYSDLIELNKVDSDKFNKQVVFGWGVKEVGKDTASLIPLLMPVAIKNDDKVKRFKYGASFLTSTVGYIQDYVLKNVNKEVDDVYIENLKKTKKVLVDKFNKIKSIKGSKIFIFDEDSKTNEKQYKEFIENVRKADTFDELLNVIKTIPAFKGIEKLPNVNFTLLAMTATNKQLENYLKNGEFLKIGKNPYVTARGAYVVAKAFEEAKFEKLDENAPQNYTLHYVNTLFNGNPVYKKDGNFYTFLPKANFGVNDLDKAVKLFKQSQIEVVYPSSVDSELKEKFGKKSTKKLAGSALSELMGLVSKKHSDKKKDMLEVLGNVKTEEKEDETVEIPAEAVEKTELISDEFEKVENANEKEEEKTVEKDEEVINPKEVLKTDKVIESQATIPEIDNGIVGEDELPSSLFDMDDEDIYSIDDENPFEENDNPFDDEVPTDKGGMKP